MTIKDIAKMIDHSILHPSYTDADLERECKIALNCQVAAVCVKPYAVKQSADILKGSQVKVGCVIGFPHRNSSIKVKAFEAQQACEEGAEEIDMVINIGKVLSMDWLYLEDEIKTVTDLCHDHNALIKVIFETDYITGRDDKIKLCSICTKVGADYVKTSSGFGFVKQADGAYSYRGATSQDIKLMRSYSGPFVKVKASGGIRTLDDLLVMKKAGASRIGATATVAILNEVTNRL